MPDENSNPAPKVVKRVRLTEADRKVLLEICRRPDVLREGKLHVETIVHLTGLPPSSVYNFLKSDRYLKAQLPGADVDKLQVGDNDLIDRKPEPTLPLATVDFTAGDIEQATGVARQNFKALKADWEKLGMTAEQGEKWEAYSKMGSAPMYGVLKGVGGQLISNLTLLDEIIKKDAQNILQGLLPTDSPKMVDGVEIPRDPGEVERDWRYTLFAGMNLQLQMFSHLHKSQALLARVAADLSKVTGGNKTEAKGEFASRGKK